MLKLVINENMKIFLRKSNLLIIAIFITMTVFSSVLLRFYNVFPNTQNIWGAIQDQSWLFLLVNIFTIVIAGGIVASEFAWGTVKLLLIRPVSRSKILLAKFLAIVDFSLLLVLLLFVFAFITNGFIYGFHSTGTANLFDKAGGKAILDSTFRGTLKIFAYKYAEVLIYGTMAFMFSAVSRSSAFAIGTTAITMFLGPQTLDLFSDYPWAKYILFANTDLTKYINTPPGTFPGMTLSFSIAVLAAYLAVFMAVSWAVFMKRDVAG